MGDTLDEFHIFGIAPDSNERSIRTLRIGINSFLNACNTTGLILSGPDAFLGLRFFRSFDRPTSEMLMSCMTGVEFLGSSGRSVLGMTLSSTRSCTFMRESSCNESGEEKGE